MKWQNFTNRKMKDLDPDECYRVVNRIYHQLRGKSIGKIGRGILYRKWKLMVESIGSEWVIKESEGWIRGLKFKLARSLKSPIQHLISHLEIAYRDDEQKTKHISVYHKIHSRNGNQTFKLVNYYQSKGCYRNAVEKMGMAKAIEHEILHGRIPEDVSERFLGYDIKSGGRLIEAKASNKPIDKAEIWLTPNEFLVSLELGDKYYIYFTVNALTNPKLYIIKNPSRIADLFKEEYRPDLLTGQFKKVYILYPEDYIPLAIDSDLDSYYEDINLTSNLSSGVVR